jgi:hypothetical protein
VRKKIKSTNSSSDDPGQLIQKSIESANTIDTNPNLERKGS